MKCVKNNISLLTVFFIVFITGCASTPPRGGHLGDERSSSQFDKLSDQKSLDLFYHIYNFPADNVYDEEAKNIAIDSYLEILKNRDSVEIEKSGIFDLNLRDVDLTKWSDADLIEMHKYLRNGGASSENTPDEEEPECMDYSGNRYWIAGQEEDPKEELTAKEDEITQNTREFIHLIAFSEIGMELDRRNRVQGFWGGTGYIFSGVVSITAQLAMMVAKFFVFFI